MRHLLFVALKQVDSLSVSNTLHKMKGVTYILHFMIYALFFNIIYLQHALLHSVTLHA